MIAVSDFTVGPNGLEEAGAFSDALLVAVELTPRFACSRDVAGDMLCAYRLG